MSWKTVPMKKQWLAEKSFALIFALALTFIFPMSSFAVTKWKEIVPGETKKEKASAILGEPKEINSSTYEYSSSEENIEKIVIEYKVVEPAPIVDKIDVYFSEPIPKSDFAEAMKLPENPDSQGESPEGKLQEYYGSTKSLILTYKDETTKSGVKIVSYLSRERFESMSKGIAKTTVPPNEPTEGEGKRVPMEFDIDRPGQDFQNFDLSGADPALCESACSQNPNCQAWTYVKPDTTQGPNPRCWLKTGIPDPVISTCCVSGVKRFESIQPPQQMNKPPNAPTLLSPPNTYGIWSPSINPSVTLQWQNNGDPDGDAVIFYIDIWRWDPNYGQWVIVYPIDQLRVNGTSYMLNLKPATYYTWRVYAVTAQTSNPYYAVSDWFGFVTSP